MQNHNQSGCFEELLTGSLQEPYNEKLERANNETLFRAVVCPQHMQDHNQFGNPVSIEFHIFKRDFILIGHCRICEYFHIHDNNTNTHTYNSINTYKFSI
ncbi:hypothetical protein Gotri_013365 [Gossypium trilobum]|uniref:Uncharacterized protein n=1 Tax=Gossypium trilobum TaxID=34281 RepID=A0A7J9DTC0_9ROSI|nr:hypothetical protein [Gossypium trilobum]